MHNSRRKSAKTGMPYNKKPALNLVFSDSLFYGIYKSNSADCVCYGHCFEFTLDQLATYLIEKF